MKYLTHWALAFVTAAAVLLFHYNDGTVVQTLRLKQFDLLQEYDTPVVSEDIAILTIDEKAIEKHGQWPWKRDVLANVIWQLREAGAGVIVLPILFSEYDRLNGDQELLDAMIDNSVVIAQVGSFDADKNGVPRGVAKIGDPLPFLFEWDGMLGPISEFGDNAGGVGVLNVVPEIDGVVRRIPLLMRVGADIYPALTIEVIRVAVGDPSYQVKSSAGGIDKMRVPGYPTIQTDFNGRIWLRWNKVFSHTSVADDHAFSELSGKIVIIGTTAAGLGGVIASPKGGQYNYMPAAVSLQSILDGDTISRPWWASMVELILTGILCFGMALCTVSSRYWIIGSKIIGFPILLGGISWYAWSEYLYLIDVTMPIIGIVLVSLHGVFSRFVREYTEKQAIKKQFAGYASPTVVRMLQENPELIKEGMKKEVSICFSDLRGFTPLGESFGDDVKGLTKVMNGYMDAITQPILDSDGMVIKYIGDASMHIHNAPLDDPDHPKTAVRTALNMIKQVEVFNNGTTMEGKPPIGMGAGVNTGLGYIGEMGSSARHSYDILGDAVSTAARLESACKGYGVVLIVGPSTYEVTKDDFFYLKLDNLAVKGKTVGLEIYTAIDTPHPPVFKSSKRLHDEMHRHYINQDFKEAIRHCNLLKVSFYGQMLGYYEMWIERCEYMMTQDLPADWDGIFRATTK